MPRVTEYPTSQEGPQPVASGGRTDEPSASGGRTEEQGHGKAQVPAAEAVRTHAQTQAADFPHPRGAARPREGTTTPAGEPGATAAAPGPDGEAARGIAAAAGGSAGNPGRSASAPGQDGGFVAGQSAGSGSLPGPGPGTGTGAGAGLPDTGIARREGDRLRFVGAATRRIARGIDLDEIVLGLCRATVPTFSDAILVYLRDPLPVGDERPVGPVVLRLRRTDRLRPIDEFTGAATSASTGSSSAGGPAMTPDGELDFSQLALVGPQGDLPAAELCEIRPGGALAEVLRGVRPVFGSSAAARAALPELLGADHPVPRGQRAILAPLRGRRRVIGAAVFLRTPERPAFETNDLLVAAQLATHTALGIDKAVLYGREAYIADELQRTMLPDSLPQPTGVRLASRYLPAAETARVGGDWYDAIPCPAAGWHSSSATSWGTP